MLVVVVVVVVVVECFIRVNFYGLLLVLQEVPSTKHIVMFEREHVQKIRDDFYMRFPGKMVKAMKTLTTGPALFQLVHHAASCSGARCAIILARLRHSDAHQVLGWHGRERIQRTDDAGKDSTR